MSDHVANSYYSSDGKAGQSIHQYQSAWMAHWGGTGCDASSQKHNYSFSPHEGNRDDIKPHQFLSGSEIARSARGSAENIKGLAASSRNLANESLGFQLLPTAEICQESRGSFNLKKERDISSVQAFRPQASRGKLPAALNILPVSAPAVETLNGECQFQPEGLLQLPMKQVKYHMFFGESNYSCSRQRSTVPNTLGNDEFKFDSGRTVVPSFIHRQEEIKQVTSIISSKHVTKTNLTIMGHEHCNYQGHSALLVCEEKMSNFPECDKTALKIGPVTSPYDSPAYDEQYHRMQKHFGGKFFPSSSGPSEMNKPRNLEYGQCMLKTLPHCAHDVLDSAEGIAGGQSRFSQTTHRLLITEHTEESRGTTQLNQQAFSELHRTFPLFNHGKQGLRLQLLSSSTDNEEKEAVGVVKTSENVQKNESSAETEFMDMESCKEKNHLSGINPSSSNKDMMKDPNLAPQSASPSAAVSRKRTFNLPDINIELPTSPASPDSIQKPEQSTSRTQSLDMDLLLGNTDKPGNSKSSDCQNAPLELELSSRWVKRLKLATPNSAALRIKNSNQEPFSHEDKNKFFNKTIKGYTSSAEPTMDKATKILQKSESSSIDTGTKDEDIKLSHSWIQRWRHNQDKKKPKTLVTCDPQSFKLGTEDLEKRQFPSIAAMALMGKVMNGFQPCQYNTRRRSLSLCGIPRTYNAHISGLPPQIFSLQIAKARWLDMKFSNNKVSHSDFNFKLPSV